MTTLSLKDKSHIYKRLRLKIHSTITAEAKEARASSKTREGTTMLNALGATRQMRIKN